MTAFITRRQALVSAASLVAAPMALASSATASQIAPTHQVNNNMSDGFLNLRWGPSTRYGIIQKMYPGDYLIAHRVRRGWLKVTLLDDHTVTGWASAKYIRNLSRVGSI